MEAFYKNNVYQLFVGILIISRLQQNTDYQPNVGTHHGASAVRKGKL